MERREPTIVGKGLDETDRGAISEYFEEKAEEGRELISGELEKSREQLLVIDLINQFVMTEMRTLGLEELFIPISANQIHLLSHKIFADKFGKEEATVAFHNSSTGAIIVDTGKISNRLELYKILFHESLHHFSHQKFRARKEEKTVEPYRSGFSNRGKLNGLNEGVLDTIVREILNKNRERLVEILEVKKDEDSRAYYYTRYIALLDKILTRVSETTDVSKNDLWLEYKKAFFTGNLMHLRKLPKILGEQALKVLARLGSKTHDPEDPINKKIFKYFETEDESEKEILAKEILSDGH